MRALIVFVVLLFTVCSHMFSQAIITDRPDQTESSSTLSRGSFQLETGLFLETTPTIKNFNINNTLLRLGLVKNLELRLVASFDRVDIKESTEHFQGMGDLEIGLKYRIAQGKVEIAYLGHLVLPTGHDRFTNGTAGVVNRILVAHDLTEKISIGYNLGFDYFDSQNYALTYTCAIGIPLSDKLGGFVELYGESPTFDDVLVNTDFGLTYLLQENLQLDLSYGIGLTEDFNFISTGVSWLIPN